MRTDVRWKRATICGGSKPPPYNVQTGVRERDKTPHPPLTRSPLLPSRRRIVKCYRLRPLGSAFSLLWATPFDKNNYQLFLSALTTGEGKRADGRAGEGVTICGGSKPPPYNVQTDVREASVQTDVRETLLLKNGEI